MLGRLSPTAEVAIINLICFGPFVVRNVIELTAQNTLLLFDDRRALWIIGVEVVTALLAGLLLWARGWKWSAFNLRFSMPQTIGGMALLIGSNLIIVVLYESVRALSRSDPASATISKVAVTWPVLILLTLINPLFDELFVVAYNLKALESHGAAFAISVSAAVRFACHLEQGPIAAVTILPLGLIFAMVYWRWRRLWPLVVAHGVMDFLGMMPS